MKKIIAKVLGFACSLAMMASMAMPAMAATNNYTYSVRFMAGAQGTFKSGNVTVLNADNTKAFTIAVESGSSLVEIKNLEYGQRIVFNQSLVSLNNGSKYYVKGIRESGKDNNVINNNQSSFSVTSDIDYVVGYGLLADAVAYTIEYVDLQGVELLPSETYYGNIGDKPVIAFQYIDGYIPQAYNLTGTLKADASENIFRFIYTPLSGGQPGGGGGDDGGDGGFIIPGGEDDGDGDGGVPDDGQVPDGGQLPDGGQTPDDTQTPEGGQTSDVPEGGYEPTDVPADIIDIDDEGTALAGGIADGAMKGDGTINTESPSAFFASIPLGAKIGISAGVIAVLAAGAYFLFIRKKIKK